MIEIQNPCQGKPTDMREDVSQDANEFMTFGESWFIMLICTTKQNVKRCVDIFEDKLVCSQLVDDDNTKKEMDNAERVVRKYPVE